MLTLDEFRTVTGRDMVGRDGEKIGKIDQLYTDKDGGAPTFVTVETGLLGTSTSFVPVGDAELRDDTVVVPFDKDTVKDAPSLDADSELSVEEEDRLYAHYGMTSGQAQADSDVRDTAATAGTTSATGTVGHDTSGPTTDDAMTRSEERLRVGTESVETGRARLRKYVVTEEVTTTVPVTREEVRVEREPITDGNAGAATDGPAISEEEHEVVLHEERPVVAKEAVPVERVRLDKETVTEEQQVSDEVRKEQIDLRDAESAERR